MNSSVRLMECNQLCKFFNYAMCQQANKNWPCGTSRWRDEKKKRSCIEWIASYLDNRGQHETKSEGDQQVAGGAGLVERDDRGASQQVEEQVANELGQQWTPNGTATLGGHLSPTQALLYPGHFAAANKSIRYTVRWIFIETWQCVKVNNARLSFCASTQQALK